MATCGRLKTERIDVRKAQEDEITYLRRTKGTQKPGNDSKHANGDIGLRCRCSRIKFKSIKVTEDREHIPWTLYLGATQAARILLTGFHSHVTSRAPAYCIVGMSMYCFCEILIVSLFYVPDRTQSRWANNFGRPLAQVSFYSS